MSKIKGTFAELNNEIRKAEQALNKLKNSRLWYYSLVNDAFAIYNNTIGISEAQCLVNILKDRDAPMSKDTIIEIFQFSGFDYNDNHIDQCQPDSLEVIKEQYNYYTR